MIITMRITQNSRKVSYQHRMAFWGILFVLPSIIYISAFSILPLVFALVTSLDISQGIRFQHYMALFTNEEFYRSLRSTLIYVFGTVVPVWGFSLGLALLLNSRPKGRDLWRSLLFLPTTMPIVSVALVWKLLFHFNGPLNALLQSHLGLLPIAWLTRSATAQLALIIASWWHAPSYYMILWLAGLQAIPNSYYDAAKLDGASALDSFRCITFPLLRPTLALVTILSIINGFRTFAFQQIITGGGPSDSTEIVTLLIYKVAFNYADLPLASALSIVFCAFLLVLTVLQLYAILGRRWERGY